MTKHKTHKKHGPYNLVSRSMINYAIDPILTKGWKKVGMNKKAILTEGMQDYAKVIEENYMELYNWMEKYTNNNI